MRTLRGLLTRKETKVRTAALRAVRRLCASAVAWRAAWCEYVDLFVVPCIDGPRAALGGAGARGGLGADLCLEERLEALRLFALLASRPTTAPTPAMLSSVAAVADCPKDPLRGVALETLRQLATTNLPLLACGSVQHGGGAVAAEVRPRVPPGAPAASELQSTSGALAALEEYCVDGVGVLLHSVVREDGDSNGDVVSPALAVSVCLTIAHLLDAPTGRARVGLGELQLVVSPLTDVAMETERTGGLDPERLSSMRLSVHCLVELCRTWPGLLALASGPHGLRSLFGTMLMPPAERGHAVLDFVFRLLQMAHHCREPAHPRSARHGQAASRVARSPAFLAATLLSAAASGAAATGGSAHAAHSSPLHALKPAFYRHDLRCHTIVLRLQVLIECGLLRALETAGSACDLELALRAATLLRELLRLALPPHVLPEPLSIRLHQLATLTNAWMHRKAALAEEPPDGPGGPRQAAAAYAAEPAAHYSAGGGGRAAAGGGWVGGGGSRAGVEDTATLEGRGGRGGGATDASTFRSTYTSEMALSHGHGAAGGDALGGGGGPGEAERWILQRGPAKEEDEAYAISLMLQKTEITPADAMGGADGTGGAAGGLRRGGGCSATEAAGRPPCGPVFPKRLADALCLDVVHDFNELFPGAPPLLEGLQIDLREFCPDKGGGAERGSGGRRASRRGRSDSMTALLTSGRLPSMASAPAARMHSWAMRAWKYSGLWEQLLAKSLVPNDAAIDAARSRIDMRRMQEALGMDEATLSAQVCRRRRRHRRCLGTTRLAAALLRSGSDAHAPRQPWATPPPPPALSPSALPLP